MGYIYEFNWILKISNIDEKSLLVGNSYTFSKDGVRTYPLGMPIDLVNGKWEAVARCVIESITVTTNKTTGKYKIIEIYPLEKRNLLTEQWRSFIKFTKGIDDIDDFEKIHIT